MASAQAGSSPVAPSVPGVVIDHRPAKSGIFIGSPSLVVLPAGEFIASHDFFGPGARPDRTALFASADHGRTWQPRGEVVGQYWSTLFVHQKALYLIGTSREYGSAVIRRSTDSGRTWTTPRDANSGLLLSGRYHCAPVPVVVHHGRVWRAMEDASGGGGWGREFRAFMLSAPESADLLIATNWTCSERLGWNGTWLNGKFGGWLEGNAVPAPDGEMVDLLRVDFRGLPEKAAIIHISEDGRHANFNPAKDFVDFPGGCKKFTVRFDQKSRRYWSLANVVPSQFAGKNIELVRNTLALVSSPDLHDWSVRCVVLHHPDVERHAFQYADWQFDQNDLIVVCRTAYDDAEGGAHRQHDANFLTYHEVRNFRKLTMKDSEVSFKAAPSH